MLMCTSTTSKFTIQMNCLRTDITFPTTSREPSLSTREFWFAECITMIDLTMRLCTIFSFPTKGMKVHNRTNGFLLYGKLGVDFFSTSALLNPIMKNRLRLLRARSTFYMISDNPNVSFGIVHFSLYTRRIVRRN